MLTLCFWFKLRAWWYLLKKLTDGKTLILIWNTSGYIILKSMMILSYALGKIVVHDSEIKPKI